MNKINKTIKAKKVVSLMLLGGVALLAATFAEPQQAHAVPATSNTGSSALVCVSLTAAFSTFSQNSSSANGGSSSKTTICHIPPGKPDAKMTLSVGRPSVPAHLDHGDFEGSCSELVAHEHVESLPSCTAIGAGSTEPGVWLPANTLGDATSLSTYLSQVYDGVITGQPSSTASSYREVHGQ